MSTKPFKMILDEAGLQVRVDLTDEEIADAKQRTAAELTERAILDLCSSREAALKQFLIKLAARQTDAPQILKDWAAQIDQQATATTRRA